MIYARRSRARRACSFLPSALPAPLYFCRLVGKIDNRSQSGRQSCDALLHAYGTALSCCAARCNWRYCTHIVTLCLAAARSWRPRGAPTSRSWPTWILTRWRRKTLTACSAPVSFPTRETHAAVCADAACSFWLTLVRRRRPWHKTAARRRTRRRNRQEVTIEDFNLTPSRLRKK